MGRWGIWIPGCSFLGIKRELLIQKNTLKETNWVAFYKFHSLKWFCKSLVHQSQVTVALSPVVQREGNAIWWINYFTTDMCWQNVLHNLSERDLYPFDSIIHCMNNCSLDSASTDLWSSPCKIFVLCSWERHFILRVPVSTQEYVWVELICLGKLTRCLEVTQASHPGGVTILLVGSCCRNQDKLCLNVPLGSTADCTFLR